MNKTRLPAIFLFLTLLSCGKRSDVVEIHNWNFGGRPRLIEFVRQRVDSFEKTHPGISVIQSDKSWNMIREILYADFSAGAGPDVMNTHSNFAAEFGEAGHYYPINKFPDFEEVKAWYVPHCIESTQYKGNYYGLPSSAIAFVLCCNRELFDREGIAPPKTWSQFREAAKRLTKDTDGDGVLDQFGLVLMGGDKGGFAYRMIPFFFKAGVNVMSEDLKKIEFNSPMGIAALTLFAQMYQVDHSITPGFLAYSHSEINDLFCSNTAAMSIEGPWFRGMVNDKNPGKDMYVVPVPVPDNMLAQYDTAPTLQDMVMYSINAHSKHLNEAWELLKHLRNEEADMFWVTEDLGATAVTKAAWNSSEAQKVKDMSVYMSELNHARPWPPHPSMIAIASNVFTPYCQKGVVGEMSPKAALDQAAGEAQAIIDGKK